MYVPNEDRYNYIAFRRSGKSGLLLPPISIGLWHNFGDVDDITTYQEILRTAFDHGITHFDLANNYGPPPGSAESNFGKLIKQDWEPLRDELIISTKAGYDMWKGPYGEWGSRKYLIASLNQSLKRMGLEYVDIFYSHRFDPDTPLEETMGALDYAVRSGKALYAGISSYPPDETKRASEILRNMGTPCLIHQPRYNMMDRGIEHGLLDVLEDEGIGCIVFSPLEQGILTNKYLKGIPVESRAAREVFLSKEQITSEILDRVKKLNDLAQSRGQSLAQMAIVWCLRDSRITSVLVGARNSNQMLDNIQALDNLALSPDELDEIDNILN